MRNNLRFLLGLAVFYSLLFVTDSVAQITWTRTMQGQNKVINFRPGSGGKVVYAAPHDTIGGLTISWDGGYTWTKLKGTLSPLEPHGRNYARQIWVDPKDSSVVIVGSSLPSLGVNRSSDGGSNWEQVIRDATILGESIFEVQDGSGLLYCGNSGYTTLWRSYDKGITWDTISTIDAGSPNICIIACRPGSGQEFLVGSAGGFIHKSLDTGKTWYMVHEGSELEMADVPMIAYNIANTNEALATLYNYKGKSLLRTEDGGENWVRIEVPSNQWALEIDQADPRNVFMGRFAALDTVGGSFFKSVDGGESWQDLGLDSITDIWQIDYDTTSGRIAMATSNGIFIGETRKASVEPRSPNTIEASVRVNFTTNTVIASAEIGTTFEIVDITGKKLFTNTFVQSEYRVDVADWPHGVYFVHFRHNNGYAIRRFTLLR